MHSEAIETTPTPRFSHAQPVQNFVVLSVASFGIYPAYWMYRNLRALKRHKGLAISPGWRTFGAFIPLIGLLFFKDQLQLFADTAASDGLPAPYSPWGRTLAYGLLMMFGLPGVYAIVSVAAVVFLVPVHRVLNDIWAVEQPGLPMRVGFSAAEIVFLVICAVCWGLVIALSLIGDSLVVA